MATNIADIGNRRTAQGRVTNNRDATIPTRRLIDTPQLRNREDMRNARRGDSADEVRRALGLITDTAETVADIGTQRHAQRAEKDAAQGRADEAMGQVDDAKRKTSLAYSTAIAMSRARKKVAEMELILKPEVEDLLSKGADADPTKGEQPVDLDDVNQLIENRFKSLVLGEDGKPIDFGDSAANLEVYGALEKMRPQLLQGAQEIIRAQEAEKVVRGFGDELEMKVMKGEDPDIEGFMARLPPGVDRNKTRNALLEAVINGATQAEKPDVILKAADSRRADGTTSWTPAQEAHLRDTAQRLDAELERKHEKELQENSEATLGQLSVTIRSGQRINPIKVQELISQGKLRPKDAELAFAIQERMDDEAWETQQRARANISWAQSQADRREAKAGGGVGQQAVIQSLRAQMISGDLAPGQAHREASKLFASGQISMKTYDFLVDEAKKLPTNEKAVKDAGAEFYETRLNRFITSAARFRADGKPGRASTAEFQLNANNAKVAFYRALRQGREPAEALALSVGSFPGMSPQAAAAIGAEARAKAR